MIKKLLCFFLVLALTACGETPKNDEAVKEKTAEEIKAEYISNIISSMTPEEKIGQLLFLAYRKDETGNPYLEITEDISNDVKKYAPGGIILFGENIDTEEQTKAFISEYSKISEIPLFFGIDEEGGRVSRLSASGKLEVADIPPASEMTEENVGEMYGEISKELKELGFNVDFAPVADINTNPENTVIGNRAFGSDAEYVGNMVALAVSVLEENGVSAAAKHFPGHGDTYEDSHYGSAVTHHDIDRLNATEFIPFEKAIESNVDFIMVAHILTPDIPETDPYLPATMSSFLLQDVLRENLQFKGIIITDALNMGAITNKFTNGEAEKAAFLAGCDMLLMPADTEAAFNALFLAYNKGEITDERLNFSLEKILSLKYDKGLLSYS